MLLQGRYEGVTSYFSHIDAHIDEILSDINRGS